MAKNYVQDGDTMDYTATAETKSGVPVVVGATLLVALDDVASGSVGVGAAEGVWELPKSAGLAVSQGDDVAILDGEIVAADTADSVAAGKAWLAAADADTTVWVKINA